MFLVKASAWRSVEIPPKEIIKVKKIAIALNLRGMVDSIKHPLVISKKPEKMADIMFLFILPSDNKFIRELNKKLDFITSIKTKVKQITPPINIIEEIDEFMLSEKSIFSKLSFFIFAL